MALLNPPATALGQHNAILSGVATRHFVPDFAGPLSVKAVISGEVMWQTSARRFTLDDRHLLVLNDGQQYSMEIDSRQGAETLVACFRRGFVEDVRRALTADSTQLLDDPDCRPRTTFLETLRPSESRLTGKMRLARRLLRSGARSRLAVDALFGDLAVDLLSSEDLTRGRAQLVPAAKASTRAELLTRIHRARDFIEAELGTDLTLERIARAACLSPYHCHRLFVAVIGETPHAYIARRRLERARTLLATTDAPVTAVCLRVGYTSLGSFSSRFRATFGVAPSALRKRS